MGPRLPRWLGTAAAAVVLVLAAREVVVQALWLFVAHQSQGWGDLLLALLRFMVAVGVVNGLALLAQRVTRRTDLAIGALLAAPVIGTLWAWNLSVNDRPGSFLTWDFTSERVAGQFPYRAGSTQTFQVAGKTTVAHIGADATRVCGAQPAGATRRVALLGDSFVFGKGVEDDGTLCVAMRARLDAAGRDDLALLNVGQPGANSVSYANNLAYAVDVLHADAAFVGLLVPDDSQPLDLNDHRRIVHSPLFRAVGSALDPETLLMALPPIFELSYSDFIVQAVVADGIDRIVDVAKARKIPLVIYFYGDRGLPVTWFVEHARAAAQGDPQITVLGELSPPADLHPYLVGDGHPAAAGNLWFGEQLAAHVPDRSAP
jgi:hypothetical protein